MLGKPSLTCALVLLTLAAPLVRGQRFTNPESDLNRISASVLSGDSIELLRQLTDDIGPRVIGSPAYERRH